ncbi:hypothetical protein ACJX0J_014129, partial [Zea mays]
MSIIIIFYSIITIILIALCLQIIHLLHTANLISIYPACLFIVISGAPAFKGMSLFNFSFGTLQSLEEHYCLALDSHETGKGKLMMIFCLSTELAWVEDELMEIQKSQEQSSVKSKKRPPLRRGKVSPQLPVPGHIPRPSYVGAKGLPELCKGQLHDAQGITGMRAACKLAARVLDFAGTLVKPSITTNEIDAAVHNMIIEAGAYPSPLGYHGFPKSICTSVNECVCHGVPDSTQLQNGDIINIDVNVFLNGYHGGTSRTFACGQVDDSIKHFLNAAEECLEKGISICRDGVNYRKIGKKISKLAYFYGYYVVERFVGHGIGTMYHSEPLILHHGINETPMTNPGLKAGMNFLRTKSVGCLSCLPTKTQGVWLRAKHLQL